MTSATTIYNPTQHVKQAKRFVAAHKRWHTLCENMRNAETTFGRGSVEFHTAFHAWEKGRMPSKNSKYHAYDSAAAIARYLFEAHGITLQRAETVSDIEFAILSYNFFAKA